MNIGVTENFLYKMNLILREIVNVRNKKCSKEFFR